MSKNYKYLVLMGRSVIWRLHSFFFFLAIINFFHGEREREREREIMCKMTEIEYND